MQITPSDKKEKSRGRKINGDTFFSVHSLCTELYPGHKVASLLSSKHAKSHNVLAYLTTGFDMPFPSTCILSTCIWLLQK